MTRVRAFLLVALAAGLTTVLTVRPGREAVAADAAPAADATFGENTEDVARHRWQTSQARHWRHVVVRK